jgi:hypothetical protein
MAAQRRTGAGPLLRVQGPAVVSPEQLVERIEARLAEVVVELDAAKAVHAELGALACSSPGQDAGRGLSSSPSARPPLCWGSASPRSIR